MANVLKMALIESILSLHALRWSQRRIARELEVDRETLKGRMLTQPKREELVQIQINEQLIVELYSK